MGTGKTSAAINYINHSKDNVRFLYITPYLTEVNRIIENCPKKQFREPKVLGSKIRGIKYLFEEGLNIVSTHQLFERFTQEIIELAYNNNYILIMDEVADVVRQLEISEHDLNVLLEKYCHISEKNLLVWDVKEYKGEFEKYKNLCVLECIGIYGGKAILWLFPISTFKAFRNIYILTYLFEAQTQKYYYDYYSVYYKYLHVKKTNMENLNLHLFLKLIISAIINR